MVLSGGINFAFMNGEQIFELQRSIVKLMMCLEDAYESICAKCSSDGVLAHLAPARALAHGSPTDLLRHRLRIGMAVTRDVTRRRRRRQNAWTLAACVHCVLIEFVNSTQTYPQPSSFNLEPQKTILNPNSVVHARTHAHTHTHTCTHAEKCLIICDRGIMDAVCP